MIGAGVRVALAAVLLVAAALKLASVRSSQAALATFGFSSGLLRSATWTVVVATELAVAVAVIVGSNPAAYLGAALLTVFALAIAVALGRGRAGAPCPCFGSRSRVGRLSLARNLALAIGFAVVPSLPGQNPSSEQWLAFGLIVSLVGLAILSIAVLALARQVGLLRLDLGARAALELVDEGPRIGARVPLAGRIDAPPDAQVTLAIFSSPACPLCRSLEPSVTALSRDPGLAVRVFDEHRDADVWRDLSVPGSPFAIAADREGTVVAKGTFNTPAQLETLITTAERRLREAVDV